MSHALAALDLESNHKPAQFECVNSYKRKEKKAQRIKVVPPATGNDKQERNINPFIFQSPPLTVRLFTHKRLLQCCDNLFTVYVSLAIENAARWVKAETAGSLTSLSGPGRYPDRKQLDAPLNTTLKNTWAENVKSCSRMSRASGKCNGSFFFHEEERHE